jgi:ubiquinone/menaquinone biosynthesis C-methylase UbiE
MISYNRPADLTALQAISEAQRLAFSPIAFQASVTLLRLGILSGVADAGENGVAADDLAERLSLNAYGVRVLLDMGLSVGLVWLRGDRYVLDKVGHFLLHDRMTQINMNFVADVCYDAMGRLEDSVVQRAPRGLTRFGDWPTLYPGLMALPEPARTSWFSFDHFYSTTAYSAALPIVFEHKPRHILDVGGNTGLWALACAAHDAAVRVTIADLPEQTRAARASLAQSPHAGRIDLHDVDLLDPEPRLPHGADAIWMSQLLDCFSEAQAARVLEVVTGVLRPGSSLYVLEPLADRQRHDAAAYSVNATSLYFTCIANGVSRMYRSADLLRLLRDAGLRVEAEHDNLGVGQTLLRCVKAS